jgi:hypothetical protein
MLIWDCPNDINEWVAERKGGRAHPGTCTALGWETGGKIVAGLVFYDSNGSHCLVNIAIDGGRFPRGLLFAGLRYAFSQLQLKRLTFIIADSNIRSQELCARLGAAYEATLQGAGITGDLLIYKLLPEACPIWSRIHGQRRRFAASRTGPEATNPPASSGG